MKLEANEDVKTVLDFMQKNFAAAKLIPIAEAVSSLAPILWGRYGREPINCLSLSSPISVEREPEASTQ